MMSSLGDEFPVQQARCRALLDTYRSLRGPGVNTAFAEMMIEEVLRRADQAVVSGDVIAMLRSFNEMQGCT